jgi:hypothetical protein
MTILMVLQTSDVQYQDTLIILQHTSIIFTDTAIEAIVLRRHTKVGPAVLKKKSPCPTFLPFGNLLG